jgi:adenylate kinase
MSKNILIFFGPPGSGKGTQAKMLAEKFKSPVAAPGELLRLEIKNKTKLGEKLKKFLHSGRLVPDTAVKNIIIKRLKNKDARNGFILDGYPRNLSQLKELSKILKKDISADKGVLAIWIKVGDAEIMNRLGGRRICVCGASYHLKFNPPKKKGICDLCGKKLYIRSDDKPAIIKKRIKLYYKESAPISKYWRKVGKLIEINGEQKIKKIHADIKRELKKVW